MILDEHEYLAHYGILRKSGRYPWGSGKDQNTRNKMFLDTIDDLRKQGLSETEICKGLGIPSTTQLRAAKTIAKNEQRQSQITQATQLKERGWSNVAIGKRMGIPESTVRLLLKESTQQKNNILLATADMLKSEVDSKTFLDVGSGNELHIGISEGMLKNAVAVLQEKGYNVYKISVPQLGTNQNTTVKVLCPPETTYGDLSRNKDKIRIIGKFSEDGGRSYLGLHPPKSIDPKRVQIRYAKDGGAEADGVMYVRPGVKDISLGGSNYAQVRVQVGDSHFLKGMAVYKDDLPDGVDIVFNTNKDSTGSKLDAMKPLKRRKDGTIDDANPFGANIKRQIVERDSKGNEKVTSAMNIVNEEGSWSSWSKTLSSQMLSKQSPTLAKERLNKTYEDRLSEYKRISSLTNPAVRKRLLEDFGDETDSAAVHLAAASIPRTFGHHVILPIGSMKPTEVYAPNYRDGEKVVLIRHPHGGTFEIPELVVNNRNSEAKKLIGSHAKDAIGIHHTVAERLSGADFDGDTVLVIPNNSGKIKTTPALEGLKNFDPKKEYPGYPGMKVMSADEKQHQMGKITNLIADMTVKKASTPELARAVRHSMVVIDAEKHELNWKESEARNGIKELKKKYQGDGKGHAGASTLITRAGSEARVPERKLRRASKGGSIDPATGKRVYEETGNTFTNKKGKTVISTTKVDRLAITDDAHTLSSGTPIERVYADHSNKLKSLANQARKDSLNTPNATYSSSARKVYSNEVASINAKLNIARRNAPLERQAQIIANANYKTKLREYPDMDDATKKKIKFQALTEARNRLGAGKERIVLTQKEWDAIQAGAISHTLLNKVIANADMDVVRKFATPKQPKLMTSANISKAKAMLARGFTRAEVADRLGVSLSTLDQATVE